MSKKSPTFQEGESGAWVLWVFRLEEGLKNGPVDRYLTDSVRYVNRKNGRE